MKAYDAIIVGASFAGLAVANQLRGHRVLLLDRKPVGTRQTSACGTILAVLQHWDLDQAVLQVHDRLILHTAWNEIEFCSPYPWCTFDYRCLCETLFGRSGAEFLQVSVQGFKDGRVCTAKGEFEAGCVVDASGWRSVLAASVPGWRPATRAMGFGMETICAADGHGEGSAPVEGLHFWYDPPLKPRGVAWAFPRSQGISVGLGTYDGAGAMRSSLEAFVRQLHLQPGGYHGTYLPYRLRPPVAGPIFLAGDAAGTCIGLTGEGIRAALYFGEVCGRTVRKVLEGELTLKRGLEHYAGRVRDKRMFFEIFSTAQDILPRLPPAWIDRLARMLVHDRVRTWLFKRYWSLTEAWSQAA